MSQWGPDIAVEEQLKAIRERLDKLEAPVLAAKERYRHQTVCPRCGGAGDGRLQGMGFEFSHPVTRCTECREWWTPSRYLEKSP